MAGVVRVKLTFDADARQLYELVRDLKRDFATCLVIDICLMEPCLRFLSTTKLESSDELYGPYQTRAWAQMVDTSPARRWPRAYRDHIVFLVIIVKNWKCS